MERSEGKWAHMTTVCAHLSRRSIIVERSERDSMKTYVAKQGQVAQHWYVVDATDKVLGRMATRIARMLQGKHKPEYTPHVDTGDFIVVVNAEKIQLTGKKLDQIEYQHYTGHKRGRKVVPIRQMLARHPERVLKAAVQRMLPKTILGAHMLTKLKCYAGPEHPHEAQQPQPLDL